VKAGTKLYEFLLPEYNKIEITTCDGLALNGKAIVRRFTLRLLSSLLLIRGTVFINPIPVKILLQIREKKLQISYRS